jgi:DNA adenine methylase
LQKKKNVMKSFPNIAKPFLKWAGGKGQLLSQLEAALPYELNDEEFRYFEPFVGSGAMLFFMLQKSVY